MLWQPSTVRGVRKLYFRIPSSRLILEKVTHLILTFPVMKATIKIISQTILANPEEIFSSPRLKVYGSAEVNIPEPFGLRDYNVRMSVWMSTYAKILEKDPSAMIKICPHYPEPSLPF